MMLNAWIKEVAEQLAAQHNPHVGSQLSVLKMPELLDELLDIIQELPTSPSEEEQYYYMACWFVFDVCVAQLQMAAEHRHKQATRLLQQLMAQLTHRMKTSQQPLGFWLPALNAFYEVHVDLTPELQEAFMTLASQDDEDPEETEQDSLQSIRAMFEDLAGASDFEIVEYFFSQSHAMPPEFFMDLLSDLYATDEGQEIGILFLLHPKPDVRAVVLLTLDSLMPELTLSSLALTRLKMMAQWCPDHWAPYLKRWIHLQRRKGVSFLNWVMPKKLKILATEVDGSGVQGLVVQLEQDEIFLLGGVLCKESVGVKEAWLTQLTSFDAVTQYYEDLFEGQVKLRPVNMEYFQKISGHFVALLQEKHEVPPLRFLEIQCLLGVSVVPQRLDPAELIQELGIQIMPFTAEVVTAALKRSARWFARYPFMQSWFEEMPEIDTVVNQCCHFADGVKVCDIAPACEEVMRTVFESQREKWTFHFLWTALWAKVGARANGRFWQDAVIVADAMHGGLPLREIPVMQEICYLTVMNSLETMKERGSHLGAIDLG